MLTKWSIILSLLFCALAGFLAQAQDLPSCSERDFLVEFPRVNAGYWCIELPIQVDSTADQTYTSMVFADDGTLYATHPYRGQVVALTDTDGDLIPDREIVLADGLRYPHGIALYEDILYVIGDGIIYRIVEGELEVLVDDLPGGRGFIARAILVHEGLLYAGIPSPCDFCEGDDPLHGTVIQMTLDGEERTVIAEGLRYPTALEIYQDDLWVTDVSRDAFPAAIYTDEVNRIGLDNDVVPHFGFPYCVRYENRLDLEGDFDCAGATAPVITFRAKSTPFGLHAYESSTFPEMDGRLLIVLMGASTARYISGHAIVSVGITSDGHIYEVVAPVDTSSTSNLPSRWEAPDGRHVDPVIAEFVNNQAGGLFPNLVYDVVQSPEGWLYFSVQGTGIYLLRPQG